MPATFTMIELMCVAIGFCLGAMFAGVIVFGSMKIRRSRVLAQVHSELAVAHERLRAQTLVHAQLQDQVEQITQQMQAAMYRNAELQAEKAALSAVLEEERRQGAEKIALLNQAGERLKIEFQNLAQRIFEEKSRAFADQNQLAIDRLIAPLRDQMGDFKKRVEDVYDKEARDRTALQAEIHHLKELNQRIGQEALNLTRALKGDSKIRGNWGELILERVLEASGLEKGREYDVQVSLNSETGQRFQPDALVHLPEDKQVIIDAKVSLKAYEAYFNAETPADRAKHLSAHIEAMRAHMRSLSAKDYASLQGVNSLDFTLMFVPIEAALLSAVEKESDLFREAFTKNIMLVSPSTLLVALRTIQNLWRRENQNRNALEIAAKAGALYDKFVGFVQALEEIGRHLENAASAYRTTRERLVSGRGNLVRRSVELRQLGVKSSKQLPKELEALAAEDD